MRSRCWLYLAATAGVLLAAATPAIAAVVPQAQTVKAGPGTSVRVKCDGSSASGGGGWSLLDTLSNLLLGDDDDDDEDVDGSTVEQRADSAEDDYYWLGSDLFDDTSSEEGAQREPAVPTEVSNNSLVRTRRAVPNWGLGDIDVQAGKNWSVRVFNWILVRRDPATDRVEVKLLMPNLFSPGGSYDGVDGNGGASGPRTASGGTGGIDVQSGKNWSVHVSDWVLVRRNPATGQVGVKLQVPGLYSSARGGDDDVDQL